MTSTLEKAFTALRVASILAIQDIEDGLTSQAKERLQNILSSIERKKDMISSDIRLFGITQAQRMAEDRENWEATIAEWRRWTPPDTYPLSDDELQEIEDIVAEMSQRPAANLLSRCRCGEIYDSRNGEPMCGSCTRYEEQAWADHVEDLEVALAAVRGVL